MAYSFDPIEHCIYRNTFLKDVRVSVCFQKVDAKAVNKESLTQFFAQFSGADVDINDFLQRGNVGVYTADHMIRFRFEMNYVEAKLSTPVYTSFESARPFWNFLTAYITALGVEEVFNLMVRKYSVFSYKSHVADYNVKDVMNEVFSSSLMTTIPQNTSFKGLTGFERTWSEDDSDSGTSFNAVFGFKKSDMNNEADHLTLVTSLELKDGMLRPIDIVEKAETYNKILFDAFHWCVRKDIIDNMK